MTRRNELDGPVFFPVLHQVLCAGVVLIVLAVAIVAVAI